MPEPRRGEIWLGSLDPVTGHEQSGKRPLLIVSDDRFNSGRSGLVIVVPLTSQNKRIPYHVPVVPPEGGLKTESYIKCEDVRSIAKERLELAWGQIAATTLTEVEDRLRLLMSL
jgi:mRNA interferase MazF